MSLGASVADAKLGGVRGGKRKTGLCFPEHCLDLAYLSLLHTTKVK